MCCRPNLLFYPSMYFYVRCVDAVYYTIFPLLISHTPCIAGCERLVSVPRASPPSPSHENPGCRGVLPSRAAVGVPAWMARPLTECRRCRRSFQWREVPAKEVPCWHHGPPDPTVGCPRVPTSHWAGAVLHPSGCGPPCGILCEDRSAVDWAT